MQLRFEYLFSWKRLNGSISSGFVGNNGQQGLRKIVRLGAGQAGDIGPQRFCKVDWQRSAVELDQRFGQCKNGVVGQGDRAMSRSAFGSYAETCCAFFCDLNGIIIAPIDLEATAAALVKSIFGL